MNIRTLIGIVFLFFSGDVLSQSGKKMPVISTDAFAKKNINLVHCDGYEPAAIETLIGTLSAIETQLSLNKVLLNDSNTIHVICNKSVAEIFWINELLHVNHSDSEAVEVLMEAIQTSYINENLSSIKDWMQKLGSSRQRNIRFIQIRPYSVKYCLDREYVTDDESYSYTYQMMAVVKYCGKMAKNTSNDRGFQLSMDAIDAMFEYRSISENFNSEDLDMKPIDASFDIDRTYQELKDSIRIIGQIIRANNANEQWDIIENHIGSSISLVGLADIKTVDYYQEQLNLLASFYEKNNVRQYWILDKAADFYDTLSEMDLETLQVLSFQRLNSAQANPLPLDKWKLYFTNDSFMPESKFFGQIILSPDSFMDISAIEISSDSEIMVDTTSAWEEGNTEVYEPLAKKSKTTFGIGPTYMRTYSKLGSVNSMLDVKSLPHVVFNHSAGLEIWIISGESRATYSFAASNAIIKLNSPANYSNWVFAMNFTTDFIKRKNIKFGIGQDLVFAGHKISVLEGNSVGNAHIGDPNGIDKVVNNQFLYGLDLDLLVKFGGIFAHAVGGYHYDFGDYRWQRNKVYINSSEKFSGSGFFFNVGLGVTFNN